MGFLIVWKEDDWLADQTKKKGAYQPDRSPPIGLPRAVPPLLRHATLCYTTLVWSVSARISAFGRSFVFVFGLGGMVERGREEKMKRKGKGRKKVRRKRGRGERNLLAQHLRQSTSVITPRTSRTPRTPHPPHTSRTPRTPLIVLLRSPSFALVARILVLILSWP